MSVFWLRWCMWGVGRGIEPGPGGVGKCYVCVRCESIFAVHIYVYTCTSELHTVLNTVAPYGYLLPNMYLFIADIANPDSFVKCCRHWVCIDITRFYEEQRQPSSGSAWPDCQKMTVCICCNSHTACGLCRLET